MLNNKQIMFRFRKWMKLHSLGDPILKIQVLERNNFFKSATTMVVVGERVVPAVRVGQVAATVVVDNNTPTIRPRLMLLGLADKHGLGNGWLRGLYLHVHGLLTHGPGPISDNSGSACATCSTLRTSGI